MEHLDPFGSALRDARKARGLTQQQASDAVGVTRTHWSQWEGGHIRPGHENLVAIVSALGLSEDERDRLGSAYATPRHDASSEAA